MRHITRIRSNAVGFSYFLLFPLTLPWMYSSLPLPSSGLRCPPLCPGQGADMCWLLWCFLLMPSKPVKMRWRRNCSLLMDIVFLKIISIEGTEVPLFFSLHGWPLAYFGDSPILRPVRKIRQLQCAPSCLSYLSIQWLNTGTFLVV